ncbi:hypothetical protein [Paenibacillus polymyxa]|uniref:hypothetical protein n=1 Tax=Paenibacillus polymyxa TaxID=1406 RepID=UPI0020242AB4|nr:hypothetical protein [Paenibacillus polymyxa]MDU8675349.1 hypothetical protein [Paenibacillus polymyxa]MDU8700256.1 hypothetical protein [Paenibacillus polymyxa]URJ54873.1 hypothetical protein MF623_004272 [Paenibacillus polymyxa]URJ66716.1 hypothetical protein MF620_001618 [Paenibacillus polymyxa]URJ69386.1 hypothetical protein MF624_004253 [Paenibacillus polymyxa]
MNIGELVQYLNRMSSSISEIGDKTSSGLQDIEIRLSDLDSTLTITNVLLIFLIIVIALNTFLKWKNSKN